MSANAMLDVAIGLIMMFLVLGLICTVVNEVIATALKLRAKTLRQGVVELIDNAELLKTFDSHGLISATAAAVKGKGPSYLGGRTFAAAILDSFDPQDPMLDYKQVVSSIEKLPPSNIKDALMSATVGAGEDLNKLRENVAAWFDGAMDRVSGAYKRKTQLISFLVGLAIAVILNADSFTVAKALWADESLRAQMVDVASQAIADSGDTDKLKTELPKLRNDIRPLPIGWADSPGRPDHNWYKSDGMQWYETASQYASKIIGWLFTAMAIMLGAPFWFDLLGKFMKVRASGTKPPKTEED